MAWGQAGNPFMGHQTMFHAICRITGNSTQTSQFIKSLATVLSMPTVKPTHTARGGLRWARRTNILLSSSPFSTSVFSSPAPSDGSRLQSRRNPLDKQKKPPGTTFLQPRTRKSTGQKSTWCSKSHKLRIRARRGPAVTLKLDFMSNSTLTGCALRRGLGTVCSKRLPDDYYQDETGTTKLCL